MRGRDHGALDYNAARMAYGLPAVTDWTDINPWLNAANPDVSRSLFPSFNAHFLQFLLTVLMTYFRI